MNISEINSRKNFGFSCIYLWTNMINGKHYVGQTVNFYNRIYQYKRNKFNKYMKNAVNKYGIDNFDITILEKDVENSKLTEREQYWIDFYESYKQEKGYNICKFASTTLGYKHTDESKSKMSNIAKNRYIENPNLKPYGNKNGMYGKNHTEEWKEKHSQTIKDKWENDENYRKVLTERMMGKNNIMYNTHLYGEDNGMYGKHHSKETKEKISQSLKGRKSKKSIKIKCIETNEIFDSIRMASNHFGVNVNSIYVCIKNNNRTCKGKHFTILK